MKPWIILTGAFLGLLPLKADGIVWSSYFGGKQYAFELTNQQVEEMQSWRMESGVEPPISASDAYKVARKWIDELKADPEWEWELEELSLVPVRQKEGKWVWKVLFDYRVKHDGQTGQPIRMGVFVTMNGNLVRPSVTDHSR